MPAQQVVPSFTLEHGLFDDRCWVAVERWQVDQVDQAMVVGWVVGVEMKQEDQQRATWYPSVCGCARVCEVCGVFEGV